MYYFPLLHNTASSMVNIRTDIFEKLKDELVNDLKNDPFAEDMIEIWNNENSECEDCSEGVLLTLCSQLVYDGYWKQDFRSISLQLNQILEYLQEYPEFLESEEITSHLIAIAKFIFQKCTSEGVYQPCLVFIENLIQHDLKNYLKHQLLLLYVKILLLDSETDALPAMIAADELLEDIDCDLSQSLEIRENAKREHSLIYAHTLALNEQCDEAMEKFEEFLKLAMTPLYLMPQPLLF